ncbi:MAG: CRISPR-associated protein Cmr3 [Thermoanaerobacterium sp.]|uniref:Type III-B CRISPR module-associated protein Cmr3 n=1 Tax=Thermodesulfobacterium commune TaxID=1741 RepID=A0A3B8N555_9BACT|nr:type III-B CRISPR module-associated protein Cmr3 [Thermodesulfobacterium thermophilum]MDI3478003.1 CRISPR-associated protein Cmr3 [Thermoanaerobacterium sp.]MDK2811980.1 CRISPR-associated protein Cmr3 [Petrotoga sp.]HAA83487.1 type III-B CRISPR module-associated protein Cmr3 [Thermodesulfobacterium commune]HCP10094.1 type III-B CRISPR module-associated protein Cmr3 [Thermodesulfobacterium commune]
MFIKIKPFDTLFFRTGRPFSIGADTWAETVFPPLPSTIYGAIRSFLIFNFGKLEDFKSSNHRLKDYVGCVKDSKIEYGTLSLKGVFLLKNGKLYFPSPKDLVKKKEKENLYLLQFKNKSCLFISDYDLENILLWQSNEQVDEAKGWLNYDDFIDYLKARKNEFSLLESKEFFEIEPKIGIKRSRETFSSEEDFLYRIPLIRLNKDVSILVEIDGVDGFIFPKSGVMQLGGEGKAVSFELIPDDLLKEIRDLDFQFSNGYFKIYLATPSVFKNGWYPGWINSNFEGEFNGIKLKLVACAVGKPISIGGWDIVNNKPKPMRKAVPAGSVYYFKILNFVNPSEIKEVFHLKNISDDFKDIKYFKEGFGLAILGEVKL